MCARISTTCGGRVLEERSRNWKKSTERIVGGGVVKIFRFDHFCSGIPSPLSMMLSGGRLSAGHIRAEHIVVFSYVPSTGTPGNALSRASYYALEGAATPTFGRLTMRCRDPLVSYPWKRRRILPVQCQRRGWSGPPRWGRASLGSWGRGPSTVLQRILARRRSCRAHSGRDGVHGGGS